MLAADLPSTSRLPPASTLTEECTLATTTLDHNHYSTNQQACIEFSSIMFLRFDFLSPVYKSGSVGIPNFIHPCLPGGPHHQGEPLVGSAPQRDVSPPLQQQRDVSPPLQQQRDVSPPLQQVSTQQQQHGGGSRHEDNASDLVIFTTRQAPSKLGFFKLFFTSFFCH